MDLSSILAEARSIHEDVMDGLGDQCRIERPGQDVWDEEQQQTVISYTPVWEGPCRLPAPSGGAPTVAPSGEVATPTAPVVRIPASVDGVERGDRVTVLVCAADPDLVGRELWVTFNRYRSLNSARYLICSDSQ